MRTITKSSQIHYIADLICLNNNPCRSQKLTVIVIKKSVDSSLFQGKKQSYPGKNTVIKKRLL